MEKVTEGGINSQSLVWAKNIKNAQRCKNTFKIKANVAYLWNFYALATCFEQRAEAVADRNVARLLIQDIPNGGIT